MPQGAAVSTARRGAAISSIIIDGYNLIGTDHNDLKSQRQRLVLRLSEYARLKGHDITLIFDGWKSGGISDNVSASGGISIVYSRLGDRADHVIKRTISGKKKDWIVITSDRDIMDHAWAEGCVPVSAEVFENYLSTVRTRTSGGPFHFSDDEEDHQETKGRPGGNHRRPSRKEKALQRALRKL